MEPVQNPLSFKKLFISFFLVAILIFLWQWINSPMLVTVTGTGEASVPATNATISFTFSSSAGTPQEAISNINAKALSFREFLKTKGIAEGDIAEGQVTAVPAGLVTQGAQGYQANISMAAKTIHVTDISSLISDLYVNGALVVSQPILSVEDQDKLEEDALDVAMRDAKDQAGAIGIKNLKFIRKIVAVSQATSSNTSTATTKADALTEANSATAASNGVFKIVKAVSVSYKMW